jgi:TolB-like protein/class 3 adenylate cyclase
VSELGVHRRLAAILAADVVGFSRLMGEDEAGTLAALKTHLEELIEPTVAAHEGRVVKLMGDGVLAEFPSAVEAVRCAIEVQRAMVERNAEVPEARQIQFRIGVNLGDVISEGDDIYGDGVNVAARLEGLAEPGGICLSSTVHLQVRNKVDVGFQDLGEKDLKNIAYPVHVFGVLLDGEPAPAPQPTKAWPRGPAVQFLGMLLVVMILLGGGYVGWLKLQSLDTEPASVERMALPLPEKPSIAVLPFGNLSGDPEQEYFADGITNDIITDLSKFKNVFVIASNSTFTYKGKPVKVQQVAEELGVRYVLEGSVQRTSERVRINAQLIDATTGQHLWAERYDRDTQNLFAIKDEIIETIVATLTFKVDTVERERVFRKDTENLEAYDYYLRGRDTWFGWTKEANAEAGKLFEKAIELDPNYARAYGFLTWVHVNDWRYGWSEDPDASMQRAVELAQKANALAPDDYESHWNLGFVYLYRREFDRAEAEYERALALNPNDADFLVEMSEALVYLGRPEEAIAQIKKAMRLNPHFPEWHLWDLGWAYHVAGRDEEALATLRRMNNPPPGVHQTLARVYVRLGRPEQARAEIGEFLEKEPDATLETAKRQPYKDQAQLNQMLDDLRKAGMPE